MTALFEAAGVTKRFGPRTALRDVGFELRAGELLAVIGPNGAGKTTLFNLISGDLAHDTGQIYLEGQEVSRLPPHRRGCRARPPPPR